MTAYSRGVMLAVFGTFFYACLGLSIKFAGESTGLWHIMAGRALVGFGLAIALAQYFRVPIFNGQVPGMVLTAFANFGAATLVTIALTSIPLFEALVLWYLLPAWTMLLAVRFLGARVSAVGYFCVGLAIAGTIVVLWPSGGGAFSLSWGHLAALGSSLSAAFAFVLIRYHSRQHALGHFFYFCLVTCTVSAVMLLVRAEPIIPAPYAFIGIAAAAFAGGIGQILIFASVAYIPPTETTIITMGEIVLSAIGAYFIFSEAITLRVLVGGMMIVGAGFYINMHNARKQRMTCQ